MGERGVRKNVKRVEAKIRSEKTTGKTGKLSDVPEEPPAQSSWGLDFLFGGGAEEKADKVAFSKNNKAVGSLVLRDWDLNDDHRLDAKELTHLKRNDAEKHERIMTADKDGDGERKTGEKGGWGVGSFTSLIRQSLRVLGIVRCIFFFQ